MQERSRAEPPVQMRSFGRYVEDIDDGAANEQEHERRAHAHAEECLDCAPDVMETFRSRR
jgi:hypothetical protein